MSEKRKPLNLIEILALLAMVACFLVGAFGVKLVMLGAIVTAISVGIAMLALRSGR